MPWLQDEFMTTGEQLQAEAERILAKIESQKEKFFADTAGACGCESAILVFSAEIAKLNEQMKILEGVITKIANGE